jgi:hypothetical protein
MCTRITDEFLHALDERARLFFYDFLRATQAGRCVVTMTWDTDEPLPKDIIYRVEIHDAMKHIDVISIGMDTLDVSDDGSYTSVDALPEWMQKKIAVLMLTSAVPPTHPVDGVGRRIAENIFWLVPD